jgi:hypothetical protein
MTDPAGRTWERALITGATGGIGAAIAGKLASAGTSLVVVGQRAARLEEIAANLSGEVEVMICDLGGPDLSVIEDRLREESRPIDLLVNCAGYTLAGPFHEVKLEETLGLISVNVRALVSLCHAAAGVMSTRGKGSILNISSRAAFGSRPGGAAYGASKAFVNNFSRALSAELGPLGVQVTCVCPGATLTDFFERAGMSPGDFQTNWQAADEVAAVSLAAAEAKDVIAITSQASRVSIENQIKDEWSSVVVREPDPR